jgi:hypothetical protein
VRAALICAVVVVVVVAAALGATTATAVASRSGVPPGTFSGCPHDTRPLPGRPLAAYAPTVRKAVLQFVRTSFVHLFKTPPKIAGARTTQVFLVTNWLPSGWIKRECGIALWRRSVGVSVYFPAMDPPHNPVGHCNACSHLAFLASRTLGGWTVWGDY